MNTKFQILLTMVTVATASFLQAPSNHFQATFNSTFLTENERLFRPIIIPNTTRTEQPHPVRIKETKTNELILKKILQPEESTLRKNYLEDEPKTAKFSSRYSTKREKTPQKAQPEDDDKSEETEATQIPNSLERSEDTRDDAPTTEVYRSYVNDSEDSEEEKEDISEPREAEESEISPTTNEPYAELQRPTSFRNEDLRSYETTSPAEETNSSEEEKEGGRSDDYKDYYNSGSKNYHSIQTPLNKIKYKGPHSYDDDDFDSDKTRTRLISPISRRPSTHNWPFSRPQIKSELDKLNEISDSDEKFEKTLDEGIKEEVKTKTKNPDLEIAVEKDEFKFDRNKKYNYIEERNRRKQQQKGLIAEEEKDDSRPLLQNVKQYQVDEEQPKYQARGSLAPKNKAGIWTTNLPHTTPKKLGVSSNFQGHQFLGPVVFSENAEQQKPKPIKAQKQAHRNALKGLLENEKRDQDNLTNQRLQKSIFATGSEITQSFNHLEESNDMYNAILANIQSVFGIRTQPLKSGSQKGGAGSTPEASSDESKFLTWSLPLRREN